MKLYIVRHGQTDGNIKRTMDGIRDIDLNDTGREQAKVAKDKLKDVDFDIVICSPLKRAKQTMEIINVNNIPVVYDKRVVERNCGEFTGLTFDDFDRDYYWNYHNKTTYQTAESIDQIFGRVYEFVDEIKEEYKDKTVMLVTHDGVVKIISCYVNGVPEDGNLQTLGIKNCEIKIYEM